MLCSIGGYFDRRAIESPRQGLLPQSVEVCMFGWETALANGDRSALKIQTHKMFLDTSFNSPPTVLSTVYQNFVEAAMKYYRYAKCMVGRTHPHADLLIGECVERLTTPSKPGEVGAGRKLTRDDDICRYHTRPG